jgi:predicted DNA-binding transcriptional regulator AlpA
VVALLPPPRRACRAQRAENNFARALLQECRIICSRGVKNVKTAIGDDDCALVKFEAAVTAIKAHFESRHPMFDNMRGTNLKLPRVYQDLDAAGPGSVATEVICGGRLLGRIVIKMPTPFLAAEVVRVGVEPVATAPVAVGAAKVKPKPDQRKPTQPEEQLRLAAVPGELSVIRLPELMAMLGLGRTRTLELTKDPKFPSKVKPGGPGSRAVGWFRSDVQQFLKDLPPEPKG